ncbi:MAG: glycine cleavage system aminomethyltransferase GcvT [Verrucomicrobia bacterium]|nr:MAG: glycine cleavage system aminomethyltransferase GcvT [Verrucomicrobiota bacterium]
MSDPATLKHTPLEACHLASGARMVEFGGWLMPVQYTGIMDEHRAVRSSSGMFDISHMGEVLVEGAGALEWLEQLLTNRVGKLAVTRGQYTMMLNEKGGVIDDLIIYRTGEAAYFLVINGACRDLDLEWMRSRLPSDGSVILKDLGDDYAAIALQGPDSEKILRSLYPSCEVPKRNGIAPLVASDGSIPSLVARTGYTGEDGFELFVPVAQGNGEALWQNLLAAEVKPCGLGARDTLRLEMGYPLNGSDLSPDRTPLEAGLGKFASLDDAAKGDFSGRKALETQRSKGLPSLLTPLKLTVTGPPLRSHYPVLSEGHSVGETCSGALSPSLGKGIAMAYLPPSLATPGTGLEIEVRGRRYAATVVALPFYSK